MTLKVLPKTSKVLDEFLAQILPKVLSTLLSVKFWFCLAVLIAGLVNGGIEGFTSAVAAMGFYTGTKAYQNVQFAKLNGNAKK